MICGRGPDAILREHRCVIFSAGTWRLIHGGNIDPRDPSYKIPAMLNHVGKEWRSQMKSLFL